jgi:fatty acid desaturase
MLLVLVVDAVFGSFPLVGDAFDAVWKANTRNVRLLEARLDAPERATLDRRYVLVVTALLTGVLLFVSLGVAFVTWWALGRFGVV